MLQDFLKNRLLNAASTPLQDYIKTSSRLIKSPSTQTKDYLQSAKTPSKECQDYFETDFRILKFYLKTTYMLFQGTFKITLRLWQC